MTGEISHSALSFDLESCLVGLRENTYFCVHFLCFAMCLIVVYMLLLLLSVGDLDIVALCM